jgi:hypothetical protein
LVIFSSNSSTTSNLIGSNTTEPANRSGQHVRIGVANKSAVRLAEPAVHHATLLAPQDVVATIAVEVAGADVSVQLDGMNTPVLPPMSALPIADIGPASKPRA